jgi:hypothetical protein
MATKKTTGDKLADMIYGTPTGAAFGVYPQAGKRGQRKLTAKEQLAQIFSDDRAMELPKLEDYDLSVPTMENLALSQRISARQADLKRQSDQAMSPLEKLAGGMQAGRLIGSGMYQAVKSLPTAITKGGKAAEEYIAENIYKPNQPKAYEYAEDVGNFLQSLESDYKIPPIIPEAMVLQNVIGPATRQGVRNLSTPSTLNSQAGVFIGPKAKTWNQGKADMAVAMEEAGRTPQEIWQATGTFRGADGILRQEIDDRAAKFLSPSERQERIEAAKGKIAEMKEKIKPTPQKDLFPKALTEAKKEVRDDISILKSDVKQRENNPRTQGLLAQHIFEHPELYAAYPELQNVNIVTEGGGGNARGSLSIMPSRGHYPGSMEMDIYDAGLRGDPTSTTLHEMQHAVQTLEGMGPGGNSTFAFQNPEAHGMLHKERMNMLKGLSYDDFVRQAGYTDMEQAGKDYIKYTNDLKKGIDPAYDRMLQERVAMEYYKRLLGEAEARAVQDRQLMTPSQRMETPPPASYDVPQEDLIVKPPREYADGGAVFGVTPMIGKRREDRQDRQAAKSFPLDLARGVVAGAAGMPGDIESLIRMLPGLDEKTILPTSEDVLRRIPFGSDTPVGKFASGLGILGGGSLPVGPAIRGAKAIPGALKAAARNVSTPSTLDPQAGVIKMKGGNFLTGSVEGALKGLKKPMNPNEVQEVEAHFKKIEPFYDVNNPTEMRELAGMRQHIQALKADEALNNWVDRNLGNYVKKEMATPEDPVRRLAEEGITHMPQGEIDFANQFMPEQLAVKRMMAGFDPGDAGVSNAAKGWERITDEMFNVGTAGQHTRPLTPTEIRQGYKSTVDDNPWLTKLDPSTPVYYPENMDSMSRDLGFDHILDVLREDVTSGRIRPEQLSKVSMEQAVRRTAEYDQELAAKMNAERAAKRDGLPVYKEYPEGYRWVELNRPGAFASESEAMGHSVRGYEPPHGHPDWVAGSGDRGSLGYGHGGWEAIKSGKAKVYSLVGPKGEPHVTVEVASTGMTPEQRQYKIGFLADQLQKEGKTPEDALRQAEKIYPEERKEAITQIKGKQNQAPNQEYLPFVQDFVKSGQWSGVDDIQNTGLFSARDVANIMPQGIHMSRGAREQAIERARAANELPNYMTRAEYEDMLQKHVPEDVWRYEKEKRAAEDDELLRQLQPPTEGMARGGRVHFSDNPDVMQLELAGGGLVKGLKAAAKGMQNILPAAEREANKAKFLEQSKVPQRLYHGTTATEGGKGQEAFRRIKPSKEGSLGSGVYLTPDSSRASGYAESPWDSKLNLDRHSPNVLPVHAQMRNPLILEGKGDPMIEALTKLGMDEDSASRMVERAYEQKGYIGKQVQQRAQAAGYDGLLQYRDGDLSEVVSYNPNAVKSAIGNQGTYDINDPDLNKAAGGAVRMGGGGALAKVAKAAKEAAVPLTLPRVRPTTKDILEAAERVGKQQAGEFVKTPLIGKTHNLAGRSKKEVDRLKEMEYKVTPIKDLPEMKPYEAQVGEVNIALPGDQTISDMLLESVDGIPVGTTSEGGALFGRGRLADPEDKRAFWASNIGPAELFQKKVTELADLYNTDMVTAYHLAMGQMSNNFAQHMADANLRAIDYSKLNKNKMNAFDRVVSKGYVDPTTKERVTFENWPGIASPEDALQAMKEDPKLRKWFNNRMKTEDVTKKSDLPYGKSIEWAMTEPELRNMEINLTGLSAGRMKPGAELMPDSAHQTYSHDIPGTALGRAPELSPFSISFPDATAFVRDKYREQDFTGTIQKVFPHQVVDEAYLDDMYKYYTQLRKVRGFKKGGAVQSYADGGEITADDLILEERKL